VLKGVAWVTLMTLLTLVSVDRVVCADGCTESRNGIAGDARTHGDDECNADGDCDSERDCNSDGDSDCNSGAATTSDHPHACVLCTSGLDEPSALPSLSPLGIIGRLTVAALSNVTSVPPPLLDHPPRSFVS
jgi:hypothetical protein